VGPRAGVDVGTPSSVDALAEGAADVDPDGGADGSAVAAEASGEPGRVGFAEPDAIGVGRIATPAPDGRSGKGSSLTGE
jgi:hypothetical protein